MTRGFFTCPDDDERGRVELGHFLAFYAGI